jgi:hypothetical protein
MAILGRDTGRAGVGRIETNYNTSNDECASVTVIKINRLGLRRGLPRHYCKDSSPLFLTLHGVYCELGILIIGKSYATASFLYVHPAQCHEVQKK